MSVRTRGRWWLNTPWYTDWTLWAGLATGAVGWGSNYIAHSGGEAGASERDLYFSHGLALWVTGLGDAALGLVAGFAVYVIPLVLLRGACRAIFHVPPGPLGRAHSLRLPVHGGGMSGAVVYTRTRDGKVHARVEGLPPERRKEALAVTRERAASAGFVRGDG